MGSEVGLGEGDGEGAVGGEVELGIPLAPVSAEIRGQRPKLYIKDESTWLGRGGGAYLTTAMLTGAVVLAR